MHLFITHPLPLNILLDNLLIASGSNCIDIISSSPNVTSPENLLYFRMLFVYLPCCYAFYYLYNLRWRHCRNALNKKMHVILIRSNFNKEYFVSFTYLPAYPNKRFLDSFCKHFSAILCGTYNMVKKQVLVVSFDDMLTHIIIVASLPRSMLRGILFD